MHLLQIISLINRLITVGAITTTDTWGSCSPCLSGTPGCTDPTQQTMIRAKQLTMVRVFMVRFYHK